MKIKQTTIDKSQRIYRFLGEHAPIVILAFSGFQMITGNMQGAIYSVSIAIFCIIAQKHG